MDFAGAISVSRKQCFIAGAPVWHLIRICMFVPYILLTCLSLHELYYTFLIMFLAELIYLAPDTYGLFNYLLPGPSFYSKIEGLSALVSFA